MFARSRRFRVGAIALVLFGSMAVTAVPGVSHAADASKSFVAVTPTRLMDTRQGLGGARLAPGETRVLVVVGNGPVPHLGVVAVALNVTVTNPSGPGYLTAWPSGAGHPLASNLNYVAGATVANLVTIGVGPDGSVRLFSQRATDVVVDVVGWFRSGFNPITPTRLMDTRRGLGGLVLGPGERRDLSVRQFGDKPGTPAGAVSLNVTATEPTSAGYLTVWPSDVAQPKASTLNFTPGETIPNAVVVGAGRDGLISIYNSSGSTQVIVDVTGWFAAGFEAIAPVRVMDTREGLGGIHLAPGEARNLKVTGQANIPDDGGVGAVSLNVTVTDPTAAGFVTLWPAGREQPPTSNVNFVAGQTVANAVPVGVSSSGEVTIFNSAGDTEIVVDVTGWYARSDTVPPELVSLSIDPATVDTSMQSQTITVTVHIRDDLSGVGPEGLAEVSFGRPNSGGFAIRFYERSRISGTSTDGVYQKQFTLPTMAAPGTYLISSIWINDNVGNVTVIRPDELAARGLPTGFGQVGVGDSGGPQLQSIEFDRTTVDTSTGPQDVHLTVRITDDMAGFESGGVQFYHSGQVQVAPLYGYMRQSGTALDGIYVTTLTLPRYSAPGLWYVDAVWLNDTVGNTSDLVHPELAARGVPEVEQLGAGDTTPPALVDVTFDPVAVNTSTQAQTITVTVRLTDDLAGAGERRWPAYVELASPSHHTQSVWTVQRIAGDAFDGTYQGTIVLPAYSEPGVWTVMLDVTDDIGNARQIFADELAARNLPSTITNA